ncbi:MAG TPA: FecR domain-containing protein [Steroidobacteraceae bacterium]|nr:FecR domain-containing protein [Steroidobacteraceae bacterium]
MTRAHDPKSKQESTLKTADEIERQASEWLVRVDRDGGPETSRALAAWLAAHPRHRAAFLRISTAWRRADELRRLAPPGAEPDIDLLAPDRPPVIESITEPATSQGRAAAIPLRARTATRRLSVRVSLAAAILLAVGIGIVAWMYQRPESATYSTGIGEFHRIALPDGSSVSLNTDTEIRVAYTDARREVKLLRGEAQFEVARDARRPFVVAANSLHVSVVGTTFVVRMRNDTSTDVLVSEGRVAIDSLPQTLVSAGQIALIRDGRVTMRSVDDISRRMAWTEGMLVFNGETLSEAVAEFNRYNRRRLVIEDAKLADKTIGGAFKATNPDHFAKALEMSFHIAWRVQEDPAHSEIHLSGGQ